MKQMEDRDNFYYFDKRKRNIWQKWPDPAKHPTNILWSIKFLSIKSIYICEYLYILERCLEKIHRELYMNTCDKW